MFQPLEGGGLTYAEMDKAVKHSISHRGRSLALLLDHCVRNTERLDAEMAAANAPPVT